MKRKDTEIWVDQPEGPQEAPAGKRTRGKDTDLSAESVRLSRKERRRTKDEIPGGDAPDERTLRGAPEDRAPWDDPADPAQALPPEEKPAGHELPPEKPKGNTIASVLSGNILSKSEVRRAYPYMIFVACLMFLYIANIFYTQSVYREHSALTEEVKELRAKSMTIASDKMRATRQSNIMVELERRGIPLKESLTPNKVIPRTPAHGAQENDR